MTVTCDKCGPGVAAAATFVLQSGLELSFCGHCARVNYAQLRPLIHLVRKHDLVATP